MKNFIALLFVLIFSSCGYNPILKNTSNSNDFKINIIKMQGDEKINNIIKKQLELKSDENLLDLISIARDLKISAYLDQIQIDRIVPFDQREELGMDRKLIDLNISLITFEYIQGGLKI